MKSQQKRKNAKKSVDEDERQHAPLKSRPFTGVNQGHSTVEKNSFKLSPMIKLIKPLLWPKNHLRLQILIVVSGLTVVFGCAVNLWVPIYAQKIVDSLTLPIVKSKHESGSHIDFRWDLVLIFMALKLCQGVGALSLVTCFQQITWIPLEHHARHQIQVKFFEHIHKMSLSWLMHAKMGDILGALERGTDSVTSTLEHLIYSVVPTIVDITVAMSYLSWKFGWLYGTIVGSQILLYLTLSAFIIEKRSKHQGSINASENTLRQNVVESLFNFETVKCFGNEGFESHKYSENLKGLHHRQYLIRLVTSVLQASQLFIIYSGLLACSLLLISSVVSKDSHLTVGDYVLCTSYLAQSYGPLNYLGGYYRELRVKLINAQCMLEYLKEKPQIQNSINAYNLEAADGSVEFRNVTFTSDSGECVLKNVTFSVLPKTTVALVGHSGSGKTSIVRLLLRVIEVTSGEILIDGSDVRDVTLESLRSSISIVPQDTALFNDTIRNNIKYGKLTATDYEVALAASSAQIHAKIMSFPNGYDTIVGERGTRLSGGERQRVAISRAILKDPKILILDEATSSLDSKTEREIQQSIKDLCKNRTCIMITHRLNPVVDADCILVLKEGQIVEQGTHSVLLEQNGVYAAMWKQQNKSDDKLSAVIPTSLKQDSHSWGKYQAR